MNWFFTVLLIIVSAGTAGYTGYLLRRLFVTEPAPAEAGAVSAEVPS